MNPFLFFALISASVLQLHQASGSRVRGYKSVPMCCSMLQGAAACCSVLQEGVASGSAGSKSVAFVSHARLSLQKKNQITSSVCAHESPARGMRLALLGELRASSLASKQAESSITPQVVAQLGRQGYVVLDGVLTNQQAHKALEGCDMMLRNGKLQTLRQQFALGRQDSMMVLDEWQDAWGPLPPEFEGMNLACQVLKASAAAITQHCDVDNTKKEEDTHKWADVCAPAYMQLAMYAKTGAKYVRHLDNDPLDENNKEGTVGLRVCDRVITALLYFNHDWKEEDGGYLRLYRPEEGREEEVLLDIEPLAGRLVLFESERFFHEVLPTYRSRWALSAWLTAAPPQ